MEQGLSSAEARARLKKFGANEAVPSPFSSVIAQIAETFFDPMGLMLLGLAALYFFVGNHFDAAVMLAAYVPVTAVDVVLETRAHRALKELKSTLSNTAKVLRDGVVSDVPVREIVVGDVLVFEEGQNLPADGVLLEAEGLSISEAALSGESASVQRKSGETFFGGTIVLTGSALGLVETTGRQTKFGKIARLFQETANQKSPLKRKIDRLVRLFLTFAFFFAALLFGIEIFRGAPALSSLIVALTLGMAAVPEEFPLVFTLYLSLGAWRLSKHNVLVKSLPSVETLGGVDVICTDKTGTLTEGKFKLEEIKITSKSAAENDVWLSALLACEKHAVDAMEAAIEKEAAVRKCNRDGWELTFDYPFEHQGKHMSHVWTQKNSARKIMAMKGAIEGVLEHCDAEFQGSEAIHSLARELALKGKRLMGLAMGEGPYTGERNHDEKHLRFLGILVFNDPIRSSSKGAIARCQEAGITVKMLTGDHLLTAHAVADEIGITHSHDLMFTGAQLAAMSEKEKAWAYENGAIFSRVLPEQKYELIKALKKMGKVVAMTGDGINDAPALKLADIGISLGSDATDVARSAAHMVLIHSDFSGISEAVLEGRRIFEAMKKSFSYLIFFHVPIVALALCPPAFGWGELLLPIHIVLAELIVHPVSAFTFENMKLLNAEKQKNSAQSIISKRQFLRSLFSGLLASAASAFLFYWVGRSHGAETARAMAFFAMLMSNVFFILIESRPIFTARLAVTALGISGLALAIVVFKPLAGVFHFQVISLGQIAMAAAFAAVVFVPAFPKFFARDKKMY